MNQKNDLEGSEAYYRRNVDGYEQFYGPEHAMTIRICHCYAHLLASQWKLLEGVTMHTRRYMGLEELYGPGDDGTLSSFACLIALYKFMHNMVEVEKLYQHALGKRIEALGAEHEITLDTVFKLGCLYVHESRRAKAGESLQMVVDAYSATHRMNGPAWTDENMLDAVHKLAAAKYHQGNVAPARSLFEKLLAWRVQLDGAGKHSAATLDVAMNLALILDKLGEGEEAKAIHQRFDKAYHDVEKKAAEGIAKGIGDRSEVEVVQEGIADLAVKN